MHETQSGNFDLNEKSVALLLGEFDHRMRNLLMMIEAKVRQTHSTSVEGYRAKLIARITGLYGLYQLASRHGQELGRLIKTALGGYGGARLDFNSTGLACFMLIDLDR